MKVLFLDIDGVLNNKSYHYEEGHEGMHPLDPKMIERMNTVVEKTGCKVVLSSAWRYAGLKVVQVLLKDKGATFELMDETPRSLDSRGSEIKKWMYVNKVADDQIVIVDDASDMDDLLPRLVQTTFESGLQNEHVKQIIKMLGEG